ncbi:restriction endonuclease subunit S [Streptomyces sp. NPDC057877]|uniref:restriction endonuclease subunit S n=1 Tax=Streptomyces sp. NPDC057877 TaxID=3346269 RepID=UPI0036BB0AFE
MSEWERVRLGEVVALDVDAVPITATTSYDIVGVLNRGRGLLLREPIAGDETSYKTLNRIRPNQIIYSRLKAFEGAITVAPNDLGEVYASQEFPTFTCGDRMLPEYFRLLTTTKRLWEQLQALSTGMGGRRERVKPADFLTIEVALPSLSEQYRVVDIMAAVDAQIEALKAEFEHCSAFLAGLQADWLSEGEGMRLARLDEIAQIDVGYAYKSAQFSDSPKGIRLLRGDNIAPGRLQWEGAKYWPTPVSDDDRYRLKVGDVVVGMDRTWIKSGLRVATVREQDLPCLLVQRVARMRAKAGNNQLLIEFLVNSPAFKQMILSHQTGTSVPHISGKQIASFEVWVPADEPGQEHLGNVLAQVRESEDSVLAELSRLRALRATLLASLLNQEIEIPESYDALLGEVS